jgi:hypothetical protein
MPYELLKFDRADVDARITELRAGLKANKGLSDLQGYALGVVHRRLSVDRRRYRDYGPYWWALKECLRAAGYPMGLESDSVVAAEYAGPTPLHTVVMADDFRSQHLALQVVGTKVFTVSVEGPEYVLHDSDMEAPE